MIITYIIERAVPSRRLETVNPNNPVKSILVVDDEPEVRSVIKEILIGTGIPLKVVEAADGAEAVRKILNQKFSILVTDLRMPKLTGGGLLEELLNLSPALRPKDILVLSAYPGELPQIPFSNVSFIEKPADPDLLAQYIKASLEAPHGVISKMSAELLTSFQEAAIATLAEKFSVHASANPLHKFIGLEEGAYHSQVDFSGQVSGYLRITVDELLLRAILKSEKVNVVLCELLNQIMGQGKSRLARRGISLNPGLAQIDQEVQRKGASKDLPAFGYLMSPKGTLRLECLAAGAGRGVNQGGRNDNS